MDIKTLTRGEFVLQFGLYLLLIPKTLYRVITKPAWIPDYVDEELRKEPAFQFGAFCPPLLFWLVIGVFSYFGALSFYVNGFAEDDTVNLFNDLSPWLIASGFILFLPLPLSIAFVLQMLKYRTIEVNSFKRTFFIQCYCTAPIQLTYIVIFFDIEDEVVSILLSLVLLISIAWFIYCEWKIIQKELNANALKVIGTFVLIYISYSIFMIVGMTLFLIFNMQYLRSFLDQYLDVGIK